ncbi:MAG: dihydrofolate reductase family protein [Phototrophicaceae bacterium]
MGQLVLYIASSLDGYIATSDGGLDWLKPFENADEDYGYHDLLERVGVLVMGGNTYRVVESFGEWVYPDHDSMVFSRTLSLERPAHHRASVIREDIPSTIRHLKQTSAQDIWLVGGAQIIRPCVEHHLIDEIILTLIPVMLGQGIPLFQPHAMPTHTLTLQACTPYPDGCVQLHYRTQYI